MSDAKPPAPLRTADDWNARYEHDDAPWDTGHVDAHLVAAHTSGRVTPGRVLEIGCGTGVDAVWLAQRGFEVTAVDLAPLAIERAQQRALDAGVRVDFSVGSHPPEAKFDLLYDRGCFHTCPTPEARAAFVEQMAAALAPGGHWLSICGSTDGPPRDHGPPRVSAEQLAHALEPHFEIIGLDSDWFEADIPTPARAWVVWSRRR